MSILDEREDYKLNPYLGPPEKSDYSPFYVALSLGTAFGILLIIVNLTFCWCSRYKEYWRDRHTGNRFLVSLWTCSPKNNPPLDLSELESRIQIHEQQVQKQKQTEIEIEHRSSQEYMELREKRESDV